MHLQAVHERGGYGSVGYGYSWKRSEAERNLLRTHTTAVSSRMLYRLAQDGFRPAKYFSIDRVFRNETVDRTHLAEFHQVEGGCLLQRHVRSTASSYCMHQSGSLICWRMHKTMADNGNAQLCSVTTICFEPCAL